MNEAFLYKLTPAGRLILYFHKEENSFEDTKQLLVEKGFLKRENGVIHITDEGKEFLKNATSSDAT